MEKIILASSSPRRRELMAQAGFAFEVLVSEADETIETETPGEMVEVLSERKAAAVAEEIKKQGFAEESVLLVGADTMVAIDGKKLGKPKDEKGAEEMLEELSSHFHLRPRMQRLPYDILPPQPPDADARISQGYFLPAPYHLL